MRTQSALRRKTASSRPTPQAEADPKKPVERLSRRERRKQATREALIKAAQEVIAIKGVYLAVIEEITERADVAKGSFYQYFRDRGDLLHVLLLRGLNDLHTLIAATPPPQTFPERIRILMHHHIDYFLRHEDFLLFLHQIRGLIKMKGEETPVVREAYYQHLKFLTAWLHSSGRKTSLNGAKTRALGENKISEESACAILGFLTGFLSHYAVVSSLSTLQQTSNDVESALTDACVAFLHR